MSQITIQCRLVASEPTRQHLWTLMAERNTPLINELLAQTAQHPDFDTWQQKGNLPAGVVKELCQPLRTDPRFIGQPGRFYTSAITLVKYIYKSWLKLQQRRERKLQGQLRWLEILKSDEVLCLESNCSLETLRSKATAILASLESPATDGCNTNASTTLSISPERSRRAKKKSKRKNKTKQAEEKSTPRQTLFNSYDSTDDTLTRCAIAYLLKNGCKIPQQQEDPEKFAKRRRKAEIKIERIIEQIEGSIPQGRDLTGEKWLETLQTAASTVPENEQQAKSWQDILLTKPKVIPFPVAYESNEDLTWSKNEKGRLEVRFNGLGKHTFQIYCDQRQLKWFQRFLEDQQIKRASKNQHSSSLFTLRSGRIAWQEGTSKGKPWNVHRLALHCTIDTRFWTAEGTEQINREKVAALEKTLLRLKPKLTFELFYRARLVPTFLDLWRAIAAYKTLEMLEKGDLDAQQKKLNDFRKRTESNLQKIQTPYPRPRRSLYQGQSHILVGIALGLDKPATAAVIDATTGKAITYRSIKQLLGDNYKLLSRQRTSKQRQSHQRHKAQKHSKSNQFGDSELGQYVDRLLAKAIITLAQEYQAGSIVLPKLGDMRELVQNEVQLRAEQKIPGYEEGQKQYAKRYRVSVHQWSYGRLIDAIAAQASKVGIVIEEGEQSVRGSPQQQAGAIALSAYQLRSSA
jgi:hypothetical protein